MISENSTIVQVVISKSAKEYIRRYVNLFGSSISQFCAFAINREIIRQGGSACLDAENAAALAEDDAITKENELKTFS